MTKTAQSKLLKKADEFHDPEQKIPSHGTSLAQVPALHKKVKWVPGTRNLDYGGGRYDHATEFLREKGVENFVFDPYNRDAQHNAEVKAGAPYDSCTIANVLNVIAEPGARKRVLENAKSMVKPGGAVYISVYTGDNSGAGRETSKGWQENRKTKDYQAEIEAVFGKAKPAAGGFLVTAAPKRTLTATDIVRPKYAKPSDELLTSRYKATPEEIALAKEVNDGDFLEWVLKALKKNQIKLPEDGDKLRTQLETFTKLKRSPEFKKEHSPDINQYTPAKLYELTEGGNADSLMSEKEKVRQLIAKGAKGAKLIAQSGNIKCFYITDPKLLSILGSGTNWCITQEDTAKQYMNDGPAFMFYNGEEPYALMHPNTKQFMDPKDKEIWKGVEQVYNSYDGGETSYTFFLPSNSPYQTCLGMLYDTPEFEEIVDRGDFPEVCDENPNDYNIERLFEVEEILPILNYFTLRSAAGFPMDDEDCSACIQVVEAKPDDNLNILLWAVGVHDGPNAAAQAVAERFPDKIKAAFDDLGSSLEGVQALHSLIDRARYLMGETAWTDETMKSIGAIFPAKDILSGGYHHWESPTGMDEGMNLLLQGAVTSNPTGAAADIAQRFPKASNKEWKQWYNEFVEGLDNPAAFHEAMKTQFQKKSSLTASDIVRPAKG